MDGMLLHLLHEFESLLECPSAFDTLQPILRNHIFDVAIVRTYRTATHIVFW